MGCLRILPGHSHTQPEMYGRVSSEGSEQLQEIQLCIAAALAQLQLQGAQGGVQLRVLHLPAVGSSAAQALLQAVPSSKLLTLHIERIQWYLDLSVNPCSIAAHNQLQLLTLEAVHRPEQLVQVLPALTALTLLEF